MPTTGGGDPGRPALIGEMRRVENMTTIYVAGALDNNDTGYGVHTSEFLAALRRASPFPVEAIDVSRFLQRGANVHALGPTRDDVIIFVGSAASVAIFEASPARKVCFTVWESDRLPDTWHRALSMVDEVWTASEWGAGVIRRNGVDAGKVHVVPEGIDADLFGPDGDRLAFIDGIDGFKFLHVGKAEPRKGTFELLQAFDRAFGDEPVHLVLACHNRMIPGFDTVRFIENMCLRRRRWIVPVQPLAERAGIAALYRSCDAFLAPSKAEGWGLPPLEAMASGLPTALTHYSGHTAFADDDNSTAIPFSMGLLDPGALPNFPRQDGDYGSWAEPDIDGLAQVMRRMYQDRDALRARALGQAKRIRRDWSWDAAAAKACTRIADLVGMKALEVA